ncbi:MAG: asparagine synthetase B, partial [Desulfobacterales bacterium]|nr:asparagine synthetase B [Desulfobacterales bacterium]
MCGIAGFIDFQGLAETESRERIGRMTRAIAHRGPDDAGHFTDRFAALGHRRLSIIDLASGAQPMTEATERYWIVFNGEIYNFLEIRETLLEKGYTFATRSDTEVILNAYRERGRSSVERFNGMFAFAIWDTRDRQLFVARDRVGKKPFYYFWDGRRFAFASEIKSLLAGGWSNREILPPALDAYFSFGYIPCPLSIFRDIRKLPPAQVMT